jgi:hypothetical protein
MAKSRCYSGIHIEGLKKTTKNINKSQRNISQDSSCPAEILTDYFPDTSIERYRCVNLLDPEGFTVGRQPRSFPPFAINASVPRCS